MSSTIEQPRVSKGGEPNKSRNDKFENNENLKESVSKTIMKIENETDFPRTATKHKSMHEYRIKDKTSLNEMEKQLIDGVANFWKSKAFSDVEIHCGVDGGVVMAHRILVAAISPFLRVSLQSVDSNETENITLIIPDISSENINHFLDMVCCGSSEQAVIREELQYLGFCHDSYLKLSSCRKEKLEPDEYSNILRVQKTPNITGQSVEDVTSVDIKVNQPNLIWNYFVAKGRHHAICKICSTECKTGIRSHSSLSRHLRNSHPKVYKEFIAAKRALVNLEENSLQQEDAIGDSSENSNLLTGGSTKTSLVWNYFTPQPNDRTKCNDCDQEMRTFDGSTSGMLRHLRRNHENLYLEWKIKKERRQYNTILGNTQHPIWNYFEETKEPKNYKCLQCNSHIELLDMQLILLEDHLKETHEETFKSYSKKLMDENLQLELGKDSTNGSTGVGSIQGRFSRVWELYEQIGQDQAKCIECGSILRVFSNSTSGLLRHIKRHHESLYNDFTKHKDKQSKIDPNDISNSHHTIWDWFSSKQEPNGSSSCKECNKEIEQADLPSLINHLKDFHPNQHVIYNTSFKKFAKSHTISTSVEKSKKDGVKSVISVGRQAPSTPGKAGTKVNKKRGPKPKKEDTDPADRTCPDCGKSFSGKAAMRFHKRVVHSGIRPFKCEECGMTFARGDSFKGHTHSKTRSFLCTICGKTFGRKNIRDQHERAHRGDRRYNCNYCNRKFMTNQQRMNHERVHTGEKPYQVLKIFQKVGKLSLIGPDFPRCRVIFFTSFAFFLTVYRLRKTIRSTASTNHTL